MIGSGLYEVEIDGETIGLEFGMLASMHTEEIADMTIFEVFKKIATGRQKPLLCYFYGGLVAYNEFRGIEKTLTIADVSKVIEKLGLNKAMDIYLKSIEAYIPKNGQAPKVTGQEA